MFPSRISYPKAIQTWNKENHKIEAITLDQLEEVFQITFCPDIIADNDYIFELMFSGFAIAQPGETSWAF